MEQVQNTLRELGLSETEIKVYIALLQMGTVQSSVLAKRTSINRSTARYTLEQLVSKRLAMVAEKEHTFYFTPENPEKILYLLEEQKKIIVQKEKQAHGIVGDLKRIMNPHTSVPKVQFYEGKEGLIRLYDSILEKGASIDSFEDNGEMLSFIPEYVEKFVATRKEKELFNRVICPGGNAVNKQSKKEFRETRTVQESEFPFTCDIKICGDLVSVFSFNDRNAVGIGIRHQEIADNFRMVFNLLWKKLGSE